MIAVRKPAELEKMRKANKVVGDALRMIEQYVRPGVTTMELNAILEEFIVAAGAKPSFKNYHGFPAASCMSIDEVVVHGIPSLRVLKEGEILSVDVGAIVEGYHGDAARTFPVGKISAEKQRLIDVTRESFFEGIKEVRAGRRLGDLSHAIQAYVEAHGYSVVREMTGHGIGRNMHEDPSIPNYGAAGSGPLLKAGYCLAIEPMVNMGKYHIEIDSLDGWTCRARDGQPSAHYENTVIVTDGDAEILTL
ncbi:MAG: type I methionyl aminopeptidase [Clostridia bacterium]|jgi:methionyl aminopeptidase|nr:type I methionyl aminopeptidase [Clostridia bacterium]